MVCFSLYQIRDSHDHSEKQGNVSVRDSSNGYTDELFICMYISTVYVTNSVTYIINLNIAICDAKT